MRNRDWRLSVVFALVLMVAGVGGCTAPMWENAGQARVVGPEVVGIEPAGGAHNPGPRAVAVVAYHTEGTATHATAMAVPLGADGAPEWPFVYRGTRRSPVEVLADLPAEQLAALGAARLQPVAGYRLRAEGDGRLTSANSAPYRAWAVVWSRTYCVSGGAVDVVAWSATGRGLEWPGGEGGAPLVDVRFPADATVVVLPHEQPRPAEDVAAARVAAVVFTPVTLAADVVLSELAGLYLLGMYVFGQTPRC